MGAGVISRATEYEKKTFLSLLECYSDIELARPFIIQESKEGKSLSELAIKFKYTKRQIQYIIDCNKICYDKSKSEITK